MNALVTMNGDCAVTMTSLELVDFINSQRGPGEAELRHADFLAKVPKVLGIDERKFSSIYRDSMNREKPCYRFPKREACLMAMSYSYELQAKVFDRMTVLEARASQPAIPQTLPEALRLAADLAEGKAAAEAKAVALAITVAEQSPKVEALERIAASEGEFLVREAAKVLRDRCKTCLIPKMQEQKLIDWLIRLRWCHRTERVNGKKGRLKVSFYGNENGYVVEKVSDKLCDDGVVRSYPQAYITAKGIENLAERLSKQEIAARASGKVYIGDRHV